MRPAPSDLACWAWTHAGCLAGLTVPQWELLIRQARSANLLARLAQRMSDQGLLHQVPDAPRQHLLDMLIASAALIADCRYSPQSSRSKWSLPGRLNVGFLASLICH